MAPSSTLDKSQLFGFWIAQMAQGVQLTLPYTVAVYMVRHYLVNAGKQPEEAIVGKLTGLLASLFPAAQFLTSYFWGYISDHLGRKPVVLVGNLTCAFSIILFGWSRNFAIAATARVLGGLLNGVQGALRTMVGETYSAQHQAVANGYLSFAWGAGTIIGPATAGLLSEPCDHMGSFMPLCQPGQLMEQRPYLLPCVCVALIQMSATVLSALLLKETRVKRKAKRAPPPPPPPQSRTPRHLNGNGAPTTPILVSDSSNRSMDLSQPLLDSGSFTREATPFAEGAPEDFNEAPLTAEGEMRRYSSGCCTYPDLSITPQVSIVSYMDPETGELTPRLSTCSVDEAPWYRLSRVYMALLGASMVSFLFNIVEEVVPLFAASPSALGGLGWTSKQLAPNLIFGGVILILFSLLIYPRVQRWLGVRGSAVIGSVLLIPSILVIPVASLKPSTLFQRSMMFLSYGMKSMAGTLAFTGSTILLNMAAPAQQLAAVNGIGQSLSAGCRAIGPAVGGYIWALSVGLTMPGHQFLVFIGMAAAAAAAAVVFANTRVPALGH